MAVKMVPTCGVVVVRDGKRVRPEIGKTFEFTAAERDSLLAAKPNSLRKPADEEGGTAAPASSTTGKAGASAEAAQTKAKDGKKAATAAKSDEQVADDKKEGGEGAGKAAGEAGDDDL